ncbi:MAG TPA: hypothetical protein PLW88_02505, partial [Syntrophorhabdaceae bacterium]|nr:hypothetical protein [Syntrophorhabdaceae bacterium]
RSMEKEFLKEDELIHTFDLKSLSPSDSIFDMEKLLWLNKEYIRHMPLERLVYEAGLSIEYMDRVGVIRENAKTLQELKDYLNIFDGDSIDNDALEYVLKINGLVNIVEIIEDAIKRDSIKDFHHLLDEIKSKTMLSRKELMISLRIILTGRKSGPPINEVFPLISKESIYKRIQCVKKRFSIN